MATLADISSAAPVSLSAPITGMNLLAHRRLFLGVLLLALAAGGCRTYGGYGTEAETLDQIQQATALFAEEHQRAQADLEALQRAAAANPTLQRYAEAYAAVLSVHGAVVEEHRTLADEAAAHRGDYRLLSRTYRAVISDQRIVQDRYDALLADMQHALDGTPAPPVELESRYQVAPQFYERIEYANARRSLADILARARAATPPVAAPAADTLAQ